ncbi:MAG: hypothetical protein OQJ96_01305 [Flavobacteriales bacterium]|nr:hypothetical protein [Flavobacteriales bacterium]MCW8911930.1 hypothetical protein [Flavobacteriales bacterium]MCW8937584.1 hypothetical protein [Flavobacteriales bacterium]MCW8968596.1 hypothetical protein [Flavobacteriales bacterium]MCW8990072.1 hypothetical protein [Flavobacteriales bacterium]
MKKTKQILLLSLLLICSINSFSQQIVVGEKDTIANISSSGIVTDAMNNQIGEITSSGVIKNAQGETLGNIVGNEFKDVSGFVRGEKVVAGSETQIKVGGEVIIATVQSGNKIIDTHTSQVLINSVGAVSETQLIAYFLFF